MYKILKAQQLNEVVYLMDVEAPMVAKHCMPGQFVIVKLDDKGERIPLTICDYDREAGTITIVFQPVGASTEKFTKLKAGDAFEDFVGPLGCPSELVNEDIEELKKEKLLFVAGGVGTAPVYPQVKWLHSRGVPVDVIIGAKTSSLLIYKEEMAMYCDNLYICTDDGSEGFHGMVTGLLENLVLEQGRQYTMSVAIGPMIMMKFAALTAKRLGLPITVSLNTLMVDGTGMCGACRVTVGGKTRFACVEGPEFDGYEVDFDEAMRRQTMYRSEEKEAGPHICKIDIRN